MNLTDAREAMYQRFATNFTAIPSSRITFDNEDFSPPVGQSWVRFSVRHNASAQETLGGVNLRKFSRIGSVIVQIFVPLDQGVRDADNLALAARDIFEGVSFNGNDIRFTDAVVREIGPDEGWYMVVMEAFFTYTRTK